MKRILVVDDALLIRKMIKDILKHVPEFEVVGEGESGIEAVQKYEELKPDITTMDIMMPFKSGIDATRSILKINPDALVVMVSAVGFETLVQEALETGAVDYLTKPFKPDALIAVLKKALNLLEK